MPKTKNNHTKPIAKKMVSIIFIQRGIFMKFIAPNANIPEATTIKKRKTGKSSAVTLITLELRNKIKIKDITPKAISKKFRPFFSIGYLIFFDL
jgi:hypothetical protein